MKMKEISINLSTGHKKVIELLIEKGSNVNAVEKRWNMTPLHLIVLYDSSFSGHEDWTDDDYLSNF